MPRRRAFTLVELLVVIGIIALLIGILMPALNRARKSARQTKCLSNLRQIGIVNNMYVNEWKGWCLPSHWGWSPPSPGWSGNSNPPAGYDPTLTDTWHGWANVWDFEKNLNAMRINSSLTTYFPAGILCPDATVVWTISAYGGYPITYSYGMNTSDESKPNLAPTFFCSWKMNQIRNASSKYFFMDALGDVSYGTSAATSSGGAAGPPHSTAYLDVALGGAGWGEVHNPPNQTNILCYRHNLGANVLFFDGHCEWLPYQTLAYDATNPSYSGTNSLTPWRPQK